MVQNTGNKETGKHQPGRANPCLPTLRHAVPQAEVPCDNEGLGGRLCKTGNAGPHQKDSHGPPGVQSCRRCDLGLQTVGTPLQALPRHLKRHSDLRPAERNLWQGSHRSRNTSLALLKRLTLKRVTGPQCPPSLPHQSLQVECCKEM